jgi:amino acid permease
MSEFPKEAYFVVGALLVVLIIVAFVSLVRPGGLLSKFAATGVIGVAVVVLFFGHKHYQKEHTMVGQVKAVGEEAMSWLGLGPEKRAWYDDFLGGRRHKK